MKRKRIIYIAVCCLGIAMTLYALHAMQQISNAKGAVSSMSSHMSGSMPGRMMGSAMENAASQYDTQVRMLLLGGIILAVGGGYMAFFRKTS